MFNPYWAYDQHDSVMNEIEFGFCSITDESSSIMHRLVKANGGRYDTTHNYWGNPHLDLRRNNVLL